MIRYFENLQAEKRNSVMFANAKYEIENELLSKEGLDYITYNINESNTKFATKANPVEVKYQFEYSLPLQGDFVFFSLFKKEKIKTKFSLDRKHGFIDEIIEKEKFSENTQIEDILKDATKLKKTINFLIDKGRLEFFNFRENGWIWITALEELGDCLENCEDLINGLGLDDCCGKNNDILYGLVMELNSNITLYKPTFMNFPSDTAYCTLPNANKNRVGFGQTFDVKNYCSKFSEALLPTINFVKQNLRIKRIFIYEPLETNKIDKPKIKHKIMNLLDYNPNDTYEIEVINQELKFTQK